MNQKLTKITLEGLAILGGCVVLFVLGVLIAKINAKFGGILMLIGFLLFIGFLIKGFMDKFKKAALQLEYYNDKGCPLIEFKTRRAFILPSEKYVPPPK